MINKNEIIWFVHLNYNPPLPLRFQRVNNLDAEIIGGHTGKHITGHGETYWSKFVNIIKLGYIPVLEAINLKLICAEWQPPSVEVLENNIKAGIYKLMNSCSS